MSSPPSGWSANPQTNHRSLVASRGSWPRYNQHSNVDLPFSENSTKKQGFQRHQASEEVICCLQTSQAATRSFTLNITAKQSSGYKPKGSTMSIPKLSHLLDEVASTINSHFAGIAHSLPALDRQQLSAFLPFRHPHHRSPLNGSAQNSNPRTEGHTYPPPPPEQTKANLSYFHHEQGQ